MFAFINLFKKYVPPQQLPKCGYGWIESPNGRRWQPPPHYIPVPKKTTKPKKRWRRFTKLFCL